MEMISIVIIIVNRKIKLVETQMETEILNLLVFLSPDNIIDICEFLHFKDVMKLSMTCKRNYQIIHNHKKYIEIFQEIKEITKSKFNLLLFKKYLKHIPTVPLGRFSSDIKKYPYGYFIYTYILSLKNVHFARKIDLVKSIGNDLTTHTCGSSKKNTIGIQIIQNKEETDVIIKQVVTNHIITEQIEIERYINEKGETIIQILFNIRNITSYIISLIIYLIRDLIKQFNKKNIFSLGSTMVVTNLINSSVSSHSVDIDKMIDYLSNRILDFEPLHEIEDKNIIEKSDTNKLIQIGKSNKDNKLYQGYNLDLFLMDEIQVDIKKIKQISNERYYHAYLNYLGY